MNPDTVPFLLSEWHYHGPSYNCGFRFHFCTTLLVKNVIPAATTPPCYADHQNDNLVWTRPIAAVVAISFPDALLSPPPLSWWPNNFYWLSFQVRYYILWRNILFLYCQYSHIFSFIMLLAPLFSCIAKHRFNTKNESSVSSISAMKIAALQFLFPVFLKKVLVGSKAIDNSSIFYDTDKNHKIILWWNFFCKEKFTESITTNSGRFCIIIVSELWLKIRARQVSGLAGS